MSTPVYNADYFIAKFEATKPEQWSVAFLNINGRQCALGQCGTISGDDGYELTPEANALASLLQPLKPNNLEESWIVVSDINDGENRSFQQSGPRARILAALHEIKSKGSQ